MFLRLLTFAPHFLVFIFPGCSGRFLLKQEQEKHHNAAMLYEKTREQLRRKEEQQRLEEEQRQKVELTIRNLELEKRTLINSMKQVAYLCHDIYVCVCVNIYAFFFFLIDDLLV